MCSVDVNKANKFGTTPLMRACIYNNVKLFNILIECKNIDVNLVSQSGRNALHYAVYMKNLKFIEILLKKGINFNQLDSKGHSPIRAITESQIQPHANKYCECVAEEEKRLKIVQIFEDIGAVFTESDRLSKYQYTAVYNKNYEKQKIFNNN